jgi:hypothetical protein
VLVWQDTTDAALEAARARARIVEAPTPVLGTHLIIGDDWRAMFRNSARNLEERRTELFNAVLERQSRGMTSRRTTTPSSSGLAGG